MDQSVDYINYNIIRNYDEDCHDYRGEGLFTQNYCYDQCCKGYAVKNSVPLPKSVVVFEFEEHKFEENYTDEFNFAMNDYCQSRCVLPSCHQESLYYDETKRILKYDDLNFFEYRVVIANTNVFNYHYKRAPCLDQLLNSLPLHLISLSGTVLALLHVWNEMNA